MANFQVDAFTIYDKTWALVTAGTLEDYNTMTISWGGLGTLWGKPVVTTYVKPIRHTWDYMEKNDFFTVSFYPEAYRGDLLTLGTKSGRDGDKVSLTQLTPKVLSNAVTFEEATTTLLCKKIYCQDLTRDNMPEDVIQEFYTREEPHRMYIGAVIEVL